MDISKNLKDWLEIANYITVIGGVLWAIVQWPKARRRREAAEHEQSYAALNDHFLKFLELQLQAPGLGTSATSREHIWDELSPQQRDQQHVLFDFLASILERAYYFLHPASAAPSAWEVEEWSTWHHWVERYARNPNFVAFWDHLDKNRDAHSYGREFVDYVRLLIKEGAVA